MTSPTSTYQLSQLSGAILHAARRFWLLRDVDQPMERENLQAQLRSGCYFGTLATELDEISQIISDMHEAQSIVMQQIIDDLLYLERHYSINKKG